MICCMPIDFIRVEAGGVNVKMLHVAPFLNDIFVVFLGHCGIILLFYFNFQAAIGPLT